MSFFNDSSSANFDNFNLTDLASDFVNYSGSEMTLTDVYTEALAHMLNIYFTPVLIITGTIGNLLSIIVFFKSKLRSTSTASYLAFLAASDLVFLLQLIPPWLKAAKISHVLAQDGFCQCFVYLTYVSSSTSAWLVVSFTIERFVAVVYPLQRTRICTVRRARSLVLIIVITCLAINTPVLKFAVPKGNDCNIDYDMMEHAARFNVVDTIFSFTAPLTIITGLNLLIITRVCKLSRARGLLVKEVEMLSRRRKNSHSSEQRITKMLLIISSVFVLLNLPAYSMRIVAYANNMGSYEYIGKWAALQQICLLLFQSNFGINFFLYCMTGKNFRQALCQMMVDSGATVEQLCCAPSNNNPPPRPRPSATNSLSINTEATVAGTSRVNYHRNSKVEELISSSSYFKLWPLKQSRQEQPQQEVHCELQVLPIQAFRFPGGQPKQPVPCWPDNSSTSNPSLAHERALPSVFRPQVFYPISFNLQPGQIAPFHNVYPLTTPFSADAESIQTLSLPSPPRQPAFIVASSSAPTSLGPGLELALRTETLPSSLSVPQSLSLSVEPASLSSATAIAPKSRFSPDLFESDMWTTYRYSSSPVRVQPLRRFSLPARLWHGLEREDMPCGWAHLPQWNPPASNPPSPAPPSPPPRPVHKPARPPICS